MPAKQGEAQQLSASISRMKARFDSLSTFEAVAAWDAEARNAADGLVAAADRWQVQADALVADANEEKDRLARLPWWKRLFASKTALRGLQEEALRFGENANRARVDAGNLLELVDYTPDNKKEQQTLLKELRLEKKELALRKKQAATAQAQLRREARVASAEAGRVLGVFYDSKLAAAERRSIRRQKEAALQPHEDEKAALERQITGLERRILWVQRFGEASED